MPYQPPIDIQSVRSLQIVAKLASEQPNYLDESDYTQEIQTFIKKLFSPPSVKAAAPAKDAQNLDVLAELEQTYTELVEHKPVKEDSAATMAYYRTRTSLLAQLLEQMARATNQKQMSEFYRTVLDILEEISTPSQRLEFQERLKEFAQ